MPDSIVVNYGRACKDERCLFLHQGGGGAVVRLDIPLRVLRLCRFKRLAVGGKLHDAFAPRGVGDGLPARAEAGPAGGGAVGAVGVEVAPVLAS